MPRDTGGGVVRRQRLVSSQPPSSPGFPAKFMFLRYGGALALTALVALESNLAGWWKMPPFHATPHASARPNNDAAAAANVGAVIDSCICS